MPKQKYRLTGMEYGEISLVDAGANQHAHVVLMKRDSPITADSILKMDFKDDAKLDASQVRDNRKKKKTPDQRKSEEDARKQKSKDKRKASADKFRARVDDNPKKGQSQRAKNFDEDKYNRVPAGDTDGGKFATKGQGKSKKAKEKKKEKKQVSRLVLGPEGKMVWDITMKKPSKVKKGAARASNDQKAALSKWLYGVTGKEGAN